MADRQNIIDTFDKLAGRIPGEDEIARFLESSNYALEKNIRENDPGYINSVEFQDRLTSILTQAEAVFGYAGRDEQTFRQIGQWIRAGVTDNQILWGWRNSPGYKQMYAGKPDYMGEKEYRGIREKMVVEAPSVAQDFAAYTGRQITQDDLNKIYFGGAGSDEIRKQYVQVQGIKASNEAMRGKRLNTQVQLTPGGPVQPLMQGRSSAIGTNAPQQEVELPVTEKYATYKDMKEGIINPKWEARATPFTKGL